jgi:hypothetical protein
MLRVLTLLFYVMFPVMILSGIVLTYDSAGSKNISEPHTEVRAANNSVGLDFLVAIPGVVFIVFGYLGGFIMLIKVPAKEITVYEANDDSDTENTLPDSVPGEKITKIPLPVWWLVKNKGVFSKVE